MYSSSKLFFIVAAIAAIFIYPSQGEKLKGNTTTEDADRLLDILSAILDASAATDETPMDDGFKANALTDKILSEVHKEIDKNKLDRLSVPDFEESFVRKVAGIPITGSFKAENGWVESLRSVERRGNARGYLNETSFFLNATVGLQTLKVGMKYKARFSLVRSSGDLTATIGRNSFSFLGGIVRPTPDECRLVLISFNVQELENISVELSGKGKILDIIRSTAATELLSHFKKQIRKPLEGKIKELLEKQLAKTKCPDLPIF